MKYTARLIVTAALRMLGADGLAALQTLFTSTKSASRAAALKAFDKALYTAALDAHDGAIDAAVRQTRFHAFALPYVDAVGALYAIDGGVKRGVATYVVALDANASKVGVLSAPDGSPQKARLIDTFTGTLALDKAYAAYRANREGQPYVVKAKGKFAVSNNGAHVNAALVTVDGYSANRKAFEVFKAHGAKGKGTARRVAGK